MKPSLLFKMILGFVALALAGVGLLIPVWPTTPFVLAALGCFSATPAMQARILRIGFFREYYESYTAGRGVRFQTVVVSLVFLWSMLALSILLTRRLWLGLLLAAIGIAVTLHILWVARPRPSGILTGRAAHED